MRIRFSVISVITVVVLVLQFAGLAASTLAYSYPLQPDDPEIEDALDFLRDSQQNDGSIDGFATSTWAVMAIVAAGEDPADWKTSSGNPSIVDYLEDNDDLIDTDKATDWERCILAITAAGENPYDFGGIDYVSELEDLYDGNQIGAEDLLNDDFWGILALVSAGEDPDSRIIRNSAIYIKDNQNEDGGWGWSIGGDSEADNTAAAIMALIAAEDSRRSEAIVDGLAFLLEMQNSDGGFPRTDPGESNSSSDSWGINALLAAGENPTASSWTTPMGSNPIDHLMSLQDPDDGSFWWKAGDSSTSRCWMTAYAIPALLGETYPVAIYEAPSPEEIVIACTPSSFNFDALTGGDARLDQVLKIWNKGEGTLEWSVSSNADWLSLKPKSGRSEGEKDKVAVSVNIDGMEPGDYDTEIVIKGDGSENSPQRTTVSLHIATELNYCKLSTTVSPLDAGTVGVDFPQPVEGYLQGTEIRLVAVPVNGSVFSCWTGDIYNVSNPVDIMLSADTEVVANFVPLDNSQIPDITLLTASPGITAGFDRATKLAIIIIVALVLAIVFIIRKSRGEAY